VCFPKNKSLIIIKDHLSPMMSRTLTKGHWDLLVLMICRFGELQTYYVWFQKHQF
jgi:hypothetical protein